MLSRRELTPEFYDAIIRHGSDLFTVLDRQGTYLCVSNSIQALLGYTPEDLVGTNVMDLIHQDDLPLAYSTLESIVSEKQITMPPFRYRSGDGSWRWISCTVTNMLDNPDVQGIVTNARDITLEKKAELQKEESQAAYKSLFFNHPDGVFYLSKEGNMETINAGVSRITGFTEEYVLGKHFSAFLHPDVVPEALREFGAALAGDAHSIYTRIVKATGELADLRITLIPVRVRGKILGIHGIAQDITNEKKANTLIQKQAEQLHNILESITAAFFALDHEWRYTYVNKVFLQYLHQTESNLLGRRIWEVYPEFVDTLLYQKLHEVLQTGEAASFEEYYSQYNATVSYTVYPFEGGVSVYANDNTAQRKAQEEVLKLSLVASKTNNGVIITDSNSKIEWVNEAFTSMFGYTLAEVAGKRPGDVLDGPDTDLSMVACIREQLAKGQPVAQEILNYKKNGEAMWATVSITPVYNEQGEVIKYVNIHIDVTEKKQAEENLLQLTTNLYKQNLDLQQFTYIVSHNLRAPVANILGLANLLGKLSPGSDMFERIVENLQTSTARLDSVIKDLNEILSIRDIGKLEPPEPVNLKAVCEDVLRGIQENWPMQHTNINLELSEDTVLMANRAYLYSIFHNLLTNAIKYRAEDRDLNISISSRNHQEGISVQIKDNGSGMDLQKVGTHLFKLYHRFHTGKEGKGIGLYLVKSQVEALGGQIEVESEVGRGTQFTLHFKK